MVPRVVLAVVCICFPAGSVLVKPLIVPKPLEPISLEIPVSIAENQVPEKIVSRLLREGIAFEELASDSGLAGEISRANSATESMTKEPVAGQPANLAMQLLASVRDLDGFEDYELPSEADDERPLRGGVSRVQNASVPKLYSSSFKGSFEGLAAATSLGAPAASGSSPLPYSDLARSDSSDKSERRNAGGGFGGGAAASRSPIAPGISFSPLSSGTGGSGTVSTNVLPTQNQFAAAISSSPLLASSTPSSNSLGATADSSGRPTLRADGKYGIPNAQYWRFGFNDENDDEVIDQADATIDFERYLGQLEGLLEGESQVVKYSPTELRSIYDDLNSEIDTRSDASPSFLTFMIIEFPIKGFHLAQEDIPGDNPNFGIH